MNFDFLANLFFIILLLVFIIIVNHKVFKGQNVTFYNFALAIIIMIFSVPVWGVYQLVFPNMIGNFFPGYKGINCTYLMESNCLKRDDCTLSTEPSLKIKPLCINK
jgi:hypothetical protein